MKRLHLVISGKVQKVGFRWFAEQRAEALGLTGYARNMHNGSVEIEVQGSAEAVDAFVEAIRRGPRTATVEHVLQSEVEVHPNSSGFDTL